MELPKGYIERFKVAPSKQQVTEYSEYVYKASKLVKQPYIVLHKRLERAFKDKTFDELLTNIKQWFHEAEKSGEKAGMIFNARFKQYREKQLTKQL